MSTKENSKNKDKNPKNKASKPDKTDPDLKEINPIEKDLPYNPEVTEHDLEILSQENIHGDGGDDQQLRERIHKVDFTGEDLDVPGSKTARKSGKKGMPDEENQLFSQGGEDKENLEEDDSAL